MQNRTLPVQITFGFGRTWSVCCFRSTFSLLQDDIEKISLWADRRPIFGLTKPGYVVDWLLSGETKWRHIERRKNRLLCNVSTIEAFVYFFGFKLPSGRIINRVAKLVWTAYLVNSLCRIFFYDEEWSSGFVICLPHYIAVSFRTFLLSLIYFAAVLFRTAANTAIFSTSLKMWTRSRWYWLSWHQDNFKFAKEYWIANLKNNWHLNSIWFLLHSSLPAHDLHQCYNWKLL